MGRRRTLTIRNISTYDTNEVRKLVRFAMAPTEPDETIVVVKHTSKRKRTGNDHFYSGMAMDHVPHSKDFKPIPESAWYAIYLRVGPPEIFPMTVGYWRYGTEKTWDPNGEWPLFKHETWQETLVAIAAHEAKHNEYQRDLRAKGHASELACELFAAEMVRRYRETL